MSETSKPTSVRYSTIVADPPWPYPEGFIRTQPSGRSMDVKRDGERAKLGLAVRRQLPYLSLTLAEICALPLRDVSADDCRLFLWTTNRYLPDALEILGCWGFTYRQTLIWEKLAGGPYPASVAPNTTEFLLVATCGKPERIGTLRSQILKVPVVRKHSVKPEALLDLIESVSPGPYLELFARRNRLGWDTWGNEALEHVEVSTR